MRLQASGQDPRLVQAPVLGVSDRVVIGMRFLAESDLPSPQEVRYNSRDHLIIFHANLRVQGVDQVVEGGGDRVSCTRSCASSGFRVKTTATR